VAGTSVLPLSGASVSNSVWLESYGPESGPKPEAERRVVTRDWFGTSVMKLLRGRPFAETDRDGGELVMIVSRAAAERLWRGRDPVGDRVEMSNRWWRVVGVVDDVLDRAFESEPVATMYVPAAQWKPLDRRYVVETPLPLSQVGPMIQGAVRDMDMTVPVRDLRKLSDVAAASLRPQRARAILVAAYAVIATLLALTGLAGVTSYSVRQRKREFAIRSALGAPTRSLTRLAMRQSLTASLLGIAAGLIGAVAFARLLREFLFGVTVLDPITFGATTVGLTLVTVLASALPAMNAGRVDLAERLRRE
jgi:hypothetical protein